MRRSVSNTEYGRSRQLRVDDLEAHELALALMHWIEYIQVAPDADGQRGRHVARARSLLERVSDSG